MNGAELLPRLLWAFAVGGGICVVGQLLLDLANLTPAHAMSILVSCGSLAGALGWYDALVEKAGFGAMLPISSFGNLLVTGAMKGAASFDLLGIFTGLLQQVSAGISGAIVFGVLTALLFRPKD